MRIYAPLLVTLATSLCVPCVAHGAAQRTFVASNGVDTNPCSTVAPCRSFGRAILQTNAGGEIVVLDSAGYGRVTVTKSVSIIAPPGIYAGISVVSGTNGVDILTPGLTVALKGLTINGQGGVQGIYMNAASVLAIDGCELSGMSANGLFVETAGASVTVRDTAARNNGNSGFAFTFASTATLDRVHAEGNLFAGIGAYHGPSLTIHNSTLANNVKGIEVVAQIGSDVTTKVMASEVTISNSSQYGIYSFAVGGNQVRMHVARSTIARSTIAGVSLKAFDNSIVLGMFSDNAFFDNPFQVSVDRATVSAVATITLTRNAFLSGTANIDFNGATIVSGTGNTIGQDDAWNTPSSNFSF